MKDNGKVSRILDLYDKFQNGSIVQTSCEAAWYSVNERSIRRDIDDIRNYYDRKNVDGSGISNRIVFDKTKQGYRLEKTDSKKLTNAETLAICKILLNGRAFTKKQMDGILNKLIDCCRPVCSQKLIREMISNEQYHYIEPRHKKEFLGTLWMLAQAIHRQQYIEIRFQQTEDKKAVKRKLKPTAIMFFEFYFYLIAFTDEDSAEKDMGANGDTYPTIYRIDQMDDIALLGETFHVPYHNRFEEGEFRKKGLFIFGGELRHIRFRYSGPSVEAVLDRLPTAKILSEKDGVYTISAEVFGKGIDMWIKSQGEMIDLL